MKKLKERKITDYSIDKKVEDFIIWYYKNFVKGNYTDIGEFSEPREMINSIEKMAVWYELRFPEYEVSRKYPGSSHEDKYANNIFIRNNQAIKDIEDVLNDDEKEVFKESVDMLQWDTLLSPKSYISSLPWSEKWFLARQRFSDIVYVNNRGGHLHLTAKGRVNDCENVKNARGGQVEYYDFVGWHITDVIAHLKSINYPIENDEILKAVEDYNKRCELKDKFLDMVMYRIIERGGNRIGPRRAFMFAQEFGRNIDIPMIYGVDFSDPGLRSFINEYIKAGGHTNLECLICYGSRNSNNEPLGVVSVEDMLKKVSANCVDKYTKEETSLHQRLVNVLASQVAIEDEAIPIVDEKQEVEQLRLERKIKRSQNRK